MLLFHEVFQKYASQCKDDIIEFTAGIRELSIYQGVILEINSPSYELYYNNDIIVKDKRDLRSNPVWVPIRGTLKIVSTSDFSITFGVFPQQILREISKLKFMWAP